MSTERLIRLAESHQRESLADNLSMSAASEVADSIKDVLSLSTEIELQAYIGHEALAPWVVFFVLEAPERHEIIVQAATSVMKDLADGNSVDSDAARSVLAKLKNAV